MLTEGKGRNLNPQLLNKQKLKSIHPLGKHDMDHTLSNLPKNEEHLLRPMKGVRTISVYWLGIDNKMQKQIWTQNNKIKGNYWKKCSVSSHFKMYGILKVDGLETVAIFWGFWLYLFITFLTCLSATINLKVQCTWGSMICTHLGTTSELALLGFHNAIVLCSFMPWDLMMAMQPVSIWKKSNKRGERVG